MEKHCRTCGKPFKVKPSHYDKKAYCSRECMTIDYRMRWAGENNPNYHNAARKTCAACGRPFESYNKQARFCSIDCARHDPDVNAQAMATRKITLTKKLKTPPKPKVYRPRQRVRRIPATNRTCKTCGHIFIGTMRRAYCDACSYVTKPCVICETPFRVHASLVAMKHTCSPVCAREYLAERQRGERSHRWQGGKTNETLIARSSYAYKDWRTEVFARDGYTCQMCGQRGGKLSAHHIKPFSTHRELMTEMWNGITLCWPCHTSIRHHEHEYEARFLEYTQHTIERVLAGKAG